MTEDEIAAGLFVANAGRCVPRPVGEGPWRCGSCGVRVDAVALVADAWLCNREFQWRRRVDTTVATDYAVIAAFER